jgi:hypothetical protein
MNNGFKYFPEKLFSNTVKMIAGLSSSVKTFDMSKPSEIYYSVKDGNWNDPTVWKTVSGRPVVTNLSFNNPVGTSIAAFSNPAFILATKAPDVYIRHKITFNVAGQYDIVVKNLFINQGGVLTWTNGGAQYKGFNVTGNIQCLGTLDYSLSSASADVFSLYGYNNRIDNFITGDTVGVGGIFTYIGSFGQQEVLALPYNNLSLQSPQAISSINVGNPANTAKFVTKNIIVKGNLTISGQAWLEMSTFDLTVNGSTSLSGGKLSKSALGLLLFKGQCTTAQGGGFFLDGNCDVECQGGLAINQLGININNFSNQGLGTWRFTTNNQTFNISNSALTIPFYNVRVEGAISVTLTTVGSGICQINGELTGTIPSSTFINSGVLYFNNPVTYSYATGVFNTTSFANTVGYIFNGNATLPYATYSSLLISGTGTKTLGANTTVNGNLSSSGGGTFELSTYDIIINGTTSLSPESNTIYPLQKSGSGNVTFVGLISCGNGFVTRKALNFSIGNPSVEVRGGISFTQQGSTTFLTGNGTWTFTTNSQNITSTAGIASPQFDCPILISGAITINQVNTSTSSFVITFTNTINGNDINSKYTMGTFTTIQNTATYNSATQPMATGVLDTSTNLNTFIYGNGNQDIRGGNYRNLTFNGGGVKTLQGNVVKTGTYVLTPPATVNLNGFTLT